MKLIRISLIVQAYSKGEVDLALLNAVEIHLVTGNSPSYVFTVPKLDDTVRDCEVRSSD